MIKARVKEIEILMDDDLYNWYNKDSGKEVGPHSIWHWHPVISAELDSFIEACKKYQYKSFIDVGAHCGIFSSAYCYLVQNHSCYSIEPIKSHTDRIHRIAQLNNFNMKAFNMALNNYVGDNKYYGDHMVNFVDEDFKKAPHNFSDQTETFDVKVTTLDELVKTHGISPEVIKLDVEGYEIPVLEKSVETLSKYPCHLFIETHRDECKTLGWKVETICDYITHEDYVMYSHDFSYEIHDLKSYVLDGDSNMRFIAMNKKTLELWNTQ